MRQINLGGKLLDFSRPMIMGVINLTPDSFYSGSRLEGIDKVVALTDRMLNDGADIIDIGAFSSRPGAVMISIEEEQQRLHPVVEALFQTFPDLHLSIDSYRSEVLRPLADKYTFIVNDITAFEEDPKILDLIKANGLPYILMHMKGMPDNMQDKAKYGDVNFEVLDFLAQKLHILQSKGIYDVIIDPGFGFGKTIDHNYQLLNKLNAFNIFELPVLAGLSRKSMIHKVLKISAEEALNGTTALNMIALQNGAKVLRVHDVKEAHQCVQLWQRLQAAVNN
jgi:dihydropteroate synthase